MKKRVISAVTAMAVIAEIFPLTAFSDKAEAAENVTETLWDQSVIDGLHLQSMDFYLDGNSHYADSVGGNFVYDYNTMAKASWHQSETSGDQSMYPAGYNFFEAANSNSNNAWQYSTEWTLSEEQKKVLYALMENGNTLQIGAQYYGHYDTQGGKTAGLPTVKLMTGSRGISATLSDDKKADTWHNVPIGWMTMKNTVESYQLIMSSSKGSGGARKDRNYSQIKCPEVYIKDVVEPKILDMSVENNEQGNKNFVCGDTMRVHVRFSEPIRVEDYDSAFSMSLFGTKFEPVEYSDDTCTVVFETTIQDDVNQQISEGNFSLSINISNNSVKDLAGNSMTESVRSFSDGDVVISGLVPRISKIEYSHAELMRDGEYETAYALAGRIKPGDRLYIDMYLNQDMQDFSGGNDEVTMNVNVGSGVYTAVLDSVYESGNMVLSASSIPAGTTFDRMRFRFEVPEDAQENDEVYIDAQNNNGRWQLTDAGSFSDIKGNLILTYDNKRLAIDPLTTISADGERILPRIYIDRTAPEIQLMRYENGQAEPAAVYESADAAAAVTGEKTNSYTVYFKSNEEVSGSVSSRLVYAPKTDPSLQTVVSEVSMGAYTESLIEGMCASFTVPEGIDSTEYDIYIETSASDNVYNVSSQRFYLAADTRSPELALTETIPSQDTDGRQRLEFKFSVSDAASQEGLRLYYRFDPNGEFLFSDDTFSAITSSDEAGDALSGTLEYYAVDGSGNSTEPRYEDFYIGGSGIRCYPTADSRVNEYLPSRDIEFEGFEAPDGDIYDYFAYRIDGGEYTITRNEDGGNMIIPADMLYDGAVISYKRIRTTEEYFDLNLEAADEYYTAYHCDNDPAQIVTELIRNDSNNLSVVSIAAPAEGHPKNITKMEITMAGVTLDVTDRFVHDGIAAASISMDNVLEMYSLPSGEYTMTVKITDANGHEGEYTVFENESIIVDAPVIQSAEVVNDTDGDLFDESLPALAESDGAEVSITSESVAKMFETSPENVKASDYRARFSMAMRYEGSAYPVYDSEGRGNDLSYTLSYDGGKSWTEFRPFENNEISDPNTAEIIDTEDGRFAVYGLSVPIEIPSDIDDIGLTCYIRVRCGANPYISEPLKVNVMTDTTAPAVSAAEIAVGSDNDGWNERIDYTRGQLKIGLFITENGFYDGGVKTEVTSLIDGSGEEIVGSGDLSEYIEITGADTGNPQVIFKKNCTAVFKTSDIWGNSSSCVYECYLIDTVEMGYDTAESSDGLKYAVLKNISDHTISAESPGSTEITEAGIAKFYEMIDSGVIMFKSGESPAVRSGDSNMVFAVLQSRLADADYDIVCGITDRYGNYQSFKVTGIVSGTEPISVMPFTSGVTNKGQTIRAVQHLEFNKPVAQLSSDIAEELNAGMEFDPETLYMRDYVYSTDVYAALDIKTGGSVYVIDRYRQLYKVEVDTSGTEFVDYSGYNVGYADQRNDILINGNSEYVYGSNSQIRITISGNNGLSVIKPFSDMMSIEGSGPQVFDSMEYYDSTVITGSTAALSGEGTVYAADLKVRNTTSGEEYNDAIVLRYKNTGPELVAQYPMLRTDSQQPQRVAYIFYDRSGIESIEDSINGNTVSRTFNYGICFASYTEEGTPHITVTDNTGNVLELDGPDVSGSFDTTTLEKGVDYVITATDPDGQPVVPGTYYKSVNVSIDHVAGGQPFKVEPSGAVEVTSESDVVFELTDAEYRKKYIQYRPPVDITPPAITVFQNNTGSMVNEIVYSILVREAGSGIDSVYVRGIGADGADLYLEKVGEQGFYSTYQFTVSDASEYTVCAADKLGNSSEAIAESNSNVVGMFELVEERNEMGITNKNVRVSISASDGRRIYTTVTGSPNDTLTAQDYMLVGNTVIFRKNGVLSLRCVDEIGNETEHTVAVTNMDVTPPVVNCTVEPVYDENGELDTGKARIRFKAEGADDGSGLVTLIRLKDDLELRDMTFEELVELWLDYTNNPDKYTGTPEFERLCEQLFYSDITLDTTYVDVDTNGKHGFAFMDSAGNVGAASVTVDIIDDTAPTVTDVSWSYEYLTAPGYTESAVSSGSLEVENGYAELNKEVSGSVTNRTVTISLTADEPVAIYGEGGTEYSNTVQKTFTANGIYNFVVADKAGNQSSVQIGVANISRDDIYIELEDRSDIVITKGQESSFDTSSLTSFRVYRYGAGGEKVYLDSYTPQIDLGGLNIDDMSSNVFDRNSPYTIRYTAWDEAGNKAELTRRVILCGADDIMVTVNGTLPDSSNSVFINGTSADIEVNNYSSAAALRVAKGQYNGAQMKTRGEELTALDGKWHIEFTDGGGWYTIGVRTLYQDIYTVRIYVSE